MENKIEKLTPTRWFLNGPGHIQAPTPIIGKRANGEPIPGNPVIIAKVLSKDPAHGPLLAAAPEQNRALIAIFQAFTRHPGNDDEKHHALTLAEAAITSATRA